MRIERSPCRIDKLEEVINNLGSDFSPVQIIERTPPNKNCKFMYVPKNKLTTSRNGSEDLKMISIHPGLLI